MSIPPSTDQTVDFQPARVPTDFWEIYKKITPSPIPTSDNYTINMVFAWQISGDEVAPGVPLVAVTVVRTCMIGDNSQATNRVMAHEIGHALGIPSHSWPTDNLMYTGTGTKIMKGQADTFNP